MKQAKVLKIENDEILFDNNLRLYAEHDQDCCESHYLSMDDLTIDDFEGLEFDLSNDEFFNRIENYGIELVPIIGHSIKIPGYGSNNGYYSSDLRLVLTNGIDHTRTYDISECQNIN